MSAPPQERIAQLCAEFRLPTVAAEVVPRFQASDHGAALATLLEVFELEAGDRRQRRVDRLRRAAKLPAGKTWDTLNLSRFPVKLQQQLEELVTGQFLDRAVNVLAFGLPGTGKTHAMAALGHRLIEQGHSVAFAPTYQLVQNLLAAKRDLDLPRMLCKLDHFEVLILDGTKVTDRGMAHLVHLPNLSELSVSNTGVTEEGVSLLTDRFPNLILSDD